jgi:hypothetical protein
MIKNTAGQSIGAQLINASDGSAFTGAVTIYVTLDNGVQAIGSVGGGACTHEGNGYHTYAPAQAETNGDLAAYTFIGTGAVPQTVQVYTRAATPDVVVTTGGISSTSFAAGAVDAAAIGANAIGSSEFAQAAADKVFSSSGASLAELAQATPTATPRPDQAIMLLYMAVRNASKATATERRILNDAGTVIAKATMSDDGTTFDQGELITGP